MNFLRTEADGVEARLQQNQLFATTDDFANFGAATAGVYLLADAGGLTPRDDEIHLRNNYTALFVQDDWTARQSDAQSRPALGLRFGIRGQGELRAACGRFLVGHAEDRRAREFRHLLRSVPPGAGAQRPAFGGTDQRNVQPGVPRGFYGSPSFVSSIALLSGLPGGCFSNNLIGNLTDAQIAAAGYPVHFRGSAASSAWIGSTTWWPRPPPIPANTVITADNVQTLTGLTPQQYADQASAAIGQPTGYFVFGPTGLLTNVIIPAQLRPTAIADSFEPPHTLGFVGVQHELTDDMAIAVDYFHRDIRNLLGLRSANIAFESRVLGRRFLPPSRKDRS